MHHTANGEVSSFQTYRRVFWLIVAVLAFFLAIGLPITGYKIVHKFRMILFNQVVQDNDAISLWFESFLHESRKRIPDREEWLQYVQRHIELNPLPSDGYICIVDSESKLRAAPNYNPDERSYSMKDMSLVPLSKSGTGFDEEHKIPIPELFNTDEAKHLGKFESASGEQLVDFRRVYIEGETWLIGVHQYESIVEERLKEMIPFIIGVGALLFLAIVIPFAFFTSALMKHHEKERMAYVNRIEQHSNELQTLAAQLRESNTNLNMMQEQKNRMYARLSHDLRAPLSSVVAACNMVSDGIYGEVNERQQKAMESVDRNISNLLKLIDSILQISRLESGQVKVENREFRLDELVNELAENFRPLAENRHLKFLLETNSSLPLLHTDRDKLYLILQNLISNAIQVTEEGYIGLKADIQDDGSVSLSVMDSGPGIKQEDQEKIFEEFSRGDQAVHGTGIGLGLTITKELAQLLGGKIELHSTYGEGSTFTFILPASCVVYHGAKTTV